MMNDLLSRRNSGRLGLEVVARLARPPGAFDELIRLQLVRDRDQRRGASMFWARRRRPGKQSMRAAALRATGSP